MDNIVLIALGVYLALAVVIIILWFVISSLRRKNKEIVAQAQSDVYSARIACENQIRTLNARHTEEINSIRQDCAAQIRHVKEDIESNKEALSKMSEKELLACVMIALNGYGSRFDRIEQYLTDDKITVIINQLFQDINVKINSITNTLTEQIDEMNNTISSDIDDIKSSTTLLKYQ